MREINNFNKLYDNCSRTVMNKAVFSNVRARVKKKYWLKKTQLLKSGKFTRKASHTKNLGLTRHLAFIIIIIMDQASS